MAKHVYTDAPAAFKILPPGEYVLTCTKAEAGIATGAKTKGSENLELTLEDGTGARLHETLIFHASTAWKVDHALKAFGVQPKKGQEVDVQPETFLGRRCWARLKVEEYDKKDGSGKGQSNKVEAFIWDKDFPEDDFGA
jgi:hypothetical protein